MGEISENVKRLREKMGLSQKKLAEILGKKDKSTVSKWEIGENKMLVSDLEMLCAALNCTPEELLGFKSQPQKINEEAQMISDEITPVLKMIEAETANMTPSELKRYLRMAKIAKDGE